MLHEGGGLGHGAGGKLTGRFVYAVAALDGDGVLHGLADAGLRLGQRLQSGLPRRADAAMPSRRSDHLTERAGRCRHGCLPQALGRPARGTMHERLRRHIRDHDVCNTPSDSSVART